MSSSIYHIAQLRPTGSFRHRLQAAANLERDEIALNHLWIPKRLLI
jgi:hypothetical protein